jgi:hypothetical protein
VGEEGGGEGVVSHWMRFVVVERKDVVMEEAERRDQGAVDVSPQSSPEGDEEDWDNAIDAERMCDDGNGDGMHRCSSGGPPAVFKRSFPILSDLRIS